MGDQKNVVECESKPALKKVPKRMVSFEMKNNKKTSTSVQVVVQLLFVRQHTTCDSQKKKTDS